MEKDGQCISDNSPVAQFNGSADEDTDPMEVFNQQLEDIIQTYGSSALLMEQQISSLEAFKDRDDQQEEPGGRLADMFGTAPGRDTTHLIRSLEMIKSPEEKVEVILKKYAELLEYHRGEQRKNTDLKKKSEDLLMQKDQLQFDLSRAILARTKLEGLCRELQEYNRTIKGENIQRSQDDEVKRREITTHFQNTLTDIQAQIEEHSNRNNKLCQENSDLAEKLNSIIRQYEQREESLEKIFKHHDVQQKLADAKLEQANILLKEAEAKHKREKEYLLKEAIDKTKKCYAMKEQELHMKKQLVLYSQKFDEFQVTLGKSNDVYITFKQEMDKMTRKMKKLEKESGLWKTRFESCNKALVDLIEDRSAKAKEFEIFVLKVDKLETLCRALQEERKGLYEKIRSIRQDMSQADLPDESILKPLVQDTLTKGLGVTSEMEKLKAEQARLQEFVASLTFSSKDEPEDSGDEEEYTECSFKLPCVPEEQSEAVSVSGVHESPCHQELKQEQVKVDRAEMENVHPIEQQEVIQKKEVTPEPVQPTDQSVKSLEAKTEGQAPEQNTGTEKGSEQQHITPEPVQPTDQSVKSLEAKTEGQAPEQNAGTEKCSEQHHVTPDVGVTKEAVPDAVLPSELKVEENQQEQPNPLPAQANSTPVPSKPEMAKPAEEKEDTGRQQAGKAEHKPPKIPKEKPVVEGAVRAEATSSSQAQPQTSKSTPAKPQGKKQGNAKKKNQSKNAKK